MKTEAELLQALKKIEDIYAWSAIQQLEKDASTAWHLKLMAEWCMGVEPGASVVESVLATVPQLDPDSAEREYLEAAKKMMRGAKE